MKIDDYDLYEKDFDEFVRRGREAFGIDEHKGHADDKGDAA